MALIPLYHVVADYIDVDANETITMGQWVKMAADGELELVDNAADDVYGIAGDTKSDSTPGIPSTNPATIGASNVDTKFTNRVSDPYDETKASGKMTVYHSGGKFATDQFEADSFAPADKLYVSANGKLTTTSGGGPQVGVVVSFGDYPSGVPGIDVNGDITLGEYLVFKMVL